MKRRCEVNGANRENKSISNEGRYALDDKAINVRKQWYFGRNGNEIDEKDSRLFILNECEHSKCLKRLKNSTID